jgi:histidine ammonia-lyase
MKRISAVAAAVGYLFAGLAGGAALTANVAPQAGAAAPGYNRASDRLSERTITLTGHDLTVAQLLEIARFGAKVQVSVDARRRQADNYGMLLEAQAESVPVYMLNRGGGLGREDVILAGDPMTPENKAKIEQRELRAFERGSTQGDGPEVADEEIVRAMMVVRANGMISEMPSPQLAQMLLDLLNADITPVVQSRGSVGEADVAILANLSGSMVGNGDAYYRGVRMPAARALQEAGLVPLKPFGLDSSTLDNSNAYSTALAALLVADAEQALDWADMTYAMDLDGMNSSVTPLSRAVQMQRPIWWLNWDAARVLEMLKGSYLFDGDPQRILADADSLRASSIRQGSAWQSWAVLRDAVLQQINSSDHNPVISVGLSPRDSWELSTPQMMKYYVKGGKYSNGQHGYIVCSANWDPYPLANEVEAFTNALANMAVAVTQRIYRFNNPFFTVTKVADVFTPEELRGLPPRADGSLVMSLWQELQLLANPVPAEGVSTDQQGNGDIESQAALKASRGRQALDAVTHLLAQDLLTGSFWMSLRNIQDPSRRFGPGPEAALASLRRRIPWQSTVGTRSFTPAATTAYEFLRTTPVASIYSAGARPPAHP